MSPLPLCKLHTVCSLHKAAHYLSPSGSVLKLLHADGRIAQAIQACSDPASCVGGSFFCCSGDEVHAVFAWVAGVSQLPCGWHQPGLMYYLFMQLWL